MRAATPWLLAWSAEDAVARARDRLLPHFPPSDPHAARPRIRYSDTNFLLLTVIAEHVTGRPMGALYRDLYATVDDVLRFGHALFTGAVFDDPSTLELMLSRFHRFGLPRSAATLAAPSWPIEYGLGVMRFAPSRALAGGRRLPVLAGHTGSTGSWLWHCPQLDLMLAGTVDQTTAVTVPFRPVSNALARLAE